MAKRFVQASPPSAIAVKSTGFAATCNRREMQPSRDREGAVLRYFCRKTKVIGLPAGLTTLTSMLPSAARL